jgi:hypothetical protein
MNFYCGNLLLFNNYHFKYQTEPSRKRPNQLFLQNPNQTIKFLFAEPNRIFVYVIESIDEANLSKEDIAHRYCIFCKQTIYRT